MSATSFGRHCGVPPEVRSFQQSDKFVMPNCMVGVELEYEDFPKVDKFDEVYPLWQYKLDHSLRGNYPAELVLTQPLCGKDLETAVYQISDDITTGVLPQPTTNERTSTHVHIDIRDLSGQQLTRFILLAVLFEELLQNFCEPSRRDNFYCSPAHNNQTLRTKLADVIPSDGDLQDELVCSSVYRASHEYSKYSGINIRTAHTFGSVEFRHLEATYDKDRLILWINLLQSIKKYAVENELPLECFPETISVMGPAGLAHEVFGSLADTLLQNTPTDDLVPCIYRGLRTAQEVVYGHALDIAHTRTSLQDSPPVVNSTWAALFGEARVLKHNARHQPKRLRRPEREYLRNFNYPTDDEDEGVEEVNSLVSPTIGELHQYTTTAPEF